jgi:excisionase family DNA binding protein
MPDFDPIEWITTGEAAELTGYATAYIRQLIKRGRLKAKKRGRDWFLDKAEVLAYVEKMTRLGDEKFNPWREELIEQGRGRRQDEGDGAG